jgi:anti-sigma B factor antagonist
MEPETSIEPETRIDDIGGISVVTLRGEIDAFSAPSLREDLRVLVEERGVRTLVIDLSAVTFLDSSGLGAIVGTLRRLRERDGQLHVVQPDSAASRIFEHTGLDGVLDLYTEREAALSAASA